MTGQPPSEPPPKRRRLRYRFLFRGRIIGNFEWICPSCGHLTRSAMKPYVYTVMCSFAPCKRAWGLGHVLHELPPARRTVPDDYTIPQGLAEAMPEGDAGAWWRSGKLMHCVHTANGTLAVPDEEAEVAPNVADDDGSEGE